MTGQATVRVLVVDDHQDTLALQAMLLERGGYEVVTATSAQAAAEAARQTPVDLLVSDIRLPDRSGLELMRQLRQQGEIEGIALSGAGDEALEQACEEAGFSRLLVKPVPPEALLEAVAALRPAPGGAAGSGGG